MITEDSELPDMVYYDKDLRRLNDLIGSAYDTLKVITSRHDMAEDLTISKSVFDYRLAQLYRSKHPEKLFRCVYDDVTVVAVPADGGYKVNVIGYDKTLENCYVVSNKDSSFQTTYTIATNFNELRDLFRITIRNLFDIRIVPNELF